MTRTHRIRIEPFVATPDTPTDDETAKCLHCGEPITLDDAGWTHDRNALALCLTHKT